MQSKYCNHNVSFIHSGHFCSASSSPLLLKSAPDTARILCRSFTPKRHRQLRVKDWSKVPAWRLERDSNTRPSGRKTSTLPMRHHVQDCRRTDKRSGTQSKNASFSNPQRTYDASWILQFWFPDVCHL